MTTIGFIGARVPLSGAFCVFAFGSAWCQEVPQAAALKVIRETASDICATVAMEGTAGHFDLTADADAKVNRGVARIVDLGFEGAAKYQSDKYKGLLREDLLVAIQDQNTCRLHVFDTLAEKILPPTVRSPRPASLPLPHDNSTRVPSETPGAPSRKNATTLGQTAEQNAEYYELWGDIFAFQALTGQQQAEIQQALEIVDGKERTSSIADGKTASEVNCQRALRQWKQALSYTSVQSTITRLKAKAQGRQLSCGTPPTRSDTFTTQCTLHDGEDSNYLIAPNRSDSDMGVDPIEGNRLRSLFRYSGNHWILSPWNLDVCSENLDGQ